MAKSDKDLLQLSRKKMEEYVDMGHFRDPHTALPYLTEGHQFGYRLAESEVEGTIELLSSSNLQLKRDAQFFIAEAKKHREKYEKLVEGLKEKLKQAEIQYNKPFQTEWENGCWYGRCEVLESLITEIEGGETNENLHTGRV